MRITSGTLRGRKLEMPNKEITRPTSDKVRQALFNMLRSRDDWCGFHASNVLDGFAGSGALGIEALSNGAKQAYFFDKDYQATQTIRESINALDLKTKAHLKKNDLLRVELSKFETSFDLIFLDPPYGRQLATKAFHHLQKHEVINERALILVEMDHDAQEEMCDNALELLSSKSYGRTVIKLYRYKI